MLFRSLQPTRRCFVVPKPDVAALRLHVQKFTPSPMLQGNGTQPYQICHAQGARYEGTGNATGLLHRPTSRHAWNLDTNLRGPRSTVRMVLLRTSTVIGYYRHLFTMIATPTVLWRPLNLALAPAPIPVLRSLGRAIVSLPLPQVRAVGNGRP